MKKIFLILVLFAFLINTSMAEQAIWPYGKSNEAPGNIEYILWNFEEGCANLIPIQNIFSNVVQFYTVSMTWGYGDDEPAYLLDRGRGMHIYPYDFFKNEDGSPVEMIYIVNGHYAFAPRNGPDKLGKYWPGMRAHAEFKKDTQYISFLSSNSQPLYVSLYDKRLNRIHYEKILPNTNRTGSNPSNFTRFCFYSPRGDIFSMNIYSNYNTWLIDDLIVGGELGYLPLPRTNYAWASENLKLLVGANYLEYGLGYDLYMRKYFTVEQIMNLNNPYFDLDFGSIEFGNGIGDEAAIVWAFNQEDLLINWGSIDDMETKDFTEYIQKGKEQPGDVFFIDSDNDNCYDQVGMFIEPQTNSEGEIEDVIRIIPEEGVCYGNSQYLEDLYNKDGSIMVTKSLPDSPKGGKNPYPKLSPKYII